MSASHLPTVDACRLTTLQARKHGKTILVVAVELDRKIRRRLEGVTRDMGIVVVETCYIPIVNIRQTVGFIAVVSRRETVVHDVSAILVWEHEVTRCFQEVFVVFLAVFIGLSRVVVVGIYITATFVFTHINQVHLYHAIDRTVMFLFYCLLFSLIVGYLTELNLHGIARCDANHVSCRTVVALLEGSEDISRIDVNLIVLFSIIIIVDIFLLYFQIRHILELLALIVFGCHLTQMVAPWSIRLVVERNIRNHGTYIVDSVG